MKKKIKGLVSLVLSITLALSFCITCVSYTAPKVIFTLLNIKNDDDSFTLEIIVSGQSEENIITSTDLVLLYNSEDACLEDYSYKEDSFCAVNTKDIGEIKISMASYPDGYENDAVIFSCTFKKEKDFNVSEDFADLTVNDASNTGNSFDFEILKSGFSPIADKINFVPKADSECIIDDDLNYIYGISERITAASFLNNYIDYSGCTVDVEPSSGKYIGTGSKITLYDSNDAVQNEYNIILFGDIDGNGIINSSDLREIRSEIIDPHLDDISKTACNLNGDQRINLTDAGIISRYIVGLSSIDQTILLD